jgi:hypothetical protein
MIFYHKGTKAQSNEGGVIETFFLVQAFDAGGSLPVCYRSGMGRPDRQED